MLHKGDRVRWSDETILSHLKSWGITQSEGSFSWISQHRGTVIDGDKAFVWIQWDHHMDARKLPIHSVSVV